MKQFWQEKLIAVHYYFRLVVSANSSLQSKHSSVFPSYWNFIMATYTVYWSSRNNYFCLQNRLSSQGSWYKSHGVSWHYRVRFVTQFESQISLYVVMIHCPIYTMSWNWVVCYIKRAARSDCAKLNSVHMYTAAPNYQYTVSNHRWKQWNENAPALNVILFWVWLRQRP